MANTGIGPFVPRDDREKALADFWYNKGKAEAELEASAKFKAAAKKKVIVTHVTICEGCGKEIKGTGVYSARNGNYHIDCWEKKLNA